MKQLEEKDILKFGYELKPTEISKEEFRPIYEKTAQAQKKILDLKNIDYQKLEETYITI